MIDECFLYEPGKRPPKSSTPFRSTFVRSLPLVAFAIALGAFGFTFPSTQESVHHISKKQYSVRSDRLAHQILPIGSRFRPAAAVRTKDEALATKSPGPCSRIKGYARDFCRDGSEDPSRCVGLKDVDCIPSPMQPPSIKGPSEEQPNYVPAPARMRNKGAPVYTKPLMKGVLYIFWFSSGGCVVGFVLEGRRWTVSYRRGEFGANITRLGWGIVGCLTIASASGVVNLLLR